MNSKETRAFRECYGRLSELRSLIGGQVPFVALTATASTAVKDNIVKSLAMFDTLIVKSDPDRKNICYSVIKLQNKDIKCNFQWMIDEVKENGKHSSKYLIFCRSHKAVSKFYSTFLNELKEHAYFNTNENNVRNYETRIIAMFHSDTDPDVKEHVIRAFSDKGSVRVVFETIAFGMGIDCKGLHTIIHYGPPNDIDDYFQESGRAGRDTTDTCHAILLHYPSCLSSRLIDSDMKAYCKNSDKCWRSLLLKKYRAADQSEFKKKHGCCDICSLECDCVNCENVPSRDCIACVNTVAKKFTCISKDSKSGSDSSFDKQVLNKDMAAELRRKLELLRNPNTEPAHSVSGNDISSGFPKVAIDELVDNFYSMKTPENIWLKTSILDWDIACMVSEFLVSFKRSLHKLSENFEPSKTHKLVSKSSEISPNEEESDSESNSDSDTSSESELNYTTYRVSTGVLTDEDDDIEVDDELSDSQSYDDTTLF